MTVAREGRGSWALVMGEGMWHSWAKDISRDAIQQQQQWQIGGLRFVGKLKDSSRDAIQQQQQQQKQQRKIGGLRLVGKLP